MPTHFIAGSKSTKESIYKEMEPGDRLQSYFNRVVFLFAIFQKLKNDLYDMLFLYFNRLRAIEIL